MNPSLVEGSKIGGGDPVVGIWGEKILTVQSEKQYSVNIQHQLKSKVAWPTRTKSMKLK